MHEYCAKCPVYPFLTPEQRRARVDHRRHRFLRILWIDLVDLVLPGRRVSLL